MLSTGGVRGAGGGGMMVGRTGHTCTALMTPLTRGGVEVVVAGGVTSVSRVRSVLDSVEIWSSETGHWRLGTRLPRRLFGAAMLELSGQPVLIGVKYYIRSFIFWKRPLFYDSMLQIIK